MSSSDLVRSHVSALAGIRRPHMTLESVGFIVISGRPPVKSEDEG